MDFGVVISSSWGTKQIIETAKAAEEAGLDFLLLTDHYLSPTSNASVDAWTALAAVAASTEKIRIGTCVTPIPFRPPAMLAKVVATVDHLSNGRVVLGVGAGWHKPEFDAYSKWEDDKTRAAKTAEGLELITKLWTAKDSFDFHGKFFRGEGLVLEPKPIQKPYPPIWFGALKPFMLKLASIYAEAWVPPVPGIDLSLYQFVISTLKKQPKSDEKPEKWREVKVRFNGTLKEITDGIEKFVRIGCDGAILSRTPYEELPTAMRKLSHEVAPFYR